MFQIPVPPAPPQPDHVPLLPGQADAILANHLITRQTLPELTVRSALARAERLGVSLAALLRAEGLMSEPDLLGMIGWLTQVPQLDPRVTAPDPALLARLGLPLAVSAGILPIARQGNAVLVATSDPATWPRWQPEVTQRLGPVRLALSTPTAIHEVMTATLAIPLRHKAESRVPIDLSARLQRPWPGAVILTLLLSVMLALILAPAPTMVALLVLVIPALCASTALRLTALWIALRPSPAPPPPVLLRPPTISLLVPLFKETDIAPRLVKRLMRLDYPRAALDVILVLEACDTETPKALSRCHLPPWMRVVVVPDGNLTTKPRALNFALEFSRGSIVGIYDAEDCPEPQQLWAVAHHFARSPPRVACLQGVLDYYNPRTNLVARLFTAEYAAWFRVMMPALERLGFPLPLGGTTVFVRRQALEEIGAWDAHNVTEDADLGIRLARFGWQTEMLASVTEEEANCRPRAWMQQRRRWIKGHLLTWAVHMRNPRRLLRDLGWRGFLGYQLVFVGAQAQVLLAPLLWSFWLSLAGMPHPIDSVLPSGAVAALVVLFLLAELAMIATAAVGLARSRHRKLGRIVPLLHIYHMCAAIAGWRALWEALRNPFYWAKTSHGHFDSTAPPGSA